jgi:hypothetical protein
MGIGGAAVYSLVVGACELVRARYRARRKSTGGTAFWCADISAMRFDGQDPKGSEPKGGVR